MISASLHSVAASLGLQLKAKVMHHHGLVARRICCHVSEAPLNGLSSPIMESSTLMNCKFRSKSPSKLPVGM